MFEMPDKTTHVELTEQEFTIAELAARTVGGVLEGLARHGLSPSSEGAASAGESVVAAFLAAAKRLIAARS